MNVVHHVSSGDTAGGQLVALRLARAARDAGHRVSFVAPAGGSFVELAEEAGFRVRLVPLAGALDARAARRLHAALRDERADLLHTHGHFGLNTVARVAGRLAGAAVVAHMHIENIFHPSPPVRAAQLALDRATARLCARILAVSEATSRALVREGYPRDRLQVVYNGVEPTDAPAVRLAPAPVVLEVARLAAVKGQLELVRALPELPGTHAVLVGGDLEAGGAFERRIAEEARRRGVADRVVLAGEQADVPSLLAGCEVVCLPSHAEGLPLVLLEAMAAGKPVVATAVGGTPELVVDGETGLLVPPGDPAALATALRSLLDDPARAEALGEAGRRRVRERFSAAAMCRAVLEVYDEIARTMRR